MRFRPLRDADLQIPPAWFDEIELRPDGWCDEDTRSAIGVDEAGVVVAAGILWTSRAHADRYWADIVVDPAHRRRGAGTAMLAHLTSLRARPLPLKTRGYVDDDRLAFAFAQGARTIQIIPPAQIRVGGRHVLRPHPAVVPAAQVPFAQVVAAWDAMYEWIHRSWSPVSDDFAAAVNVGLEDDLDRAASALAVGPDGDVLALAAVFRDGIPPVVCAETTRPGVADGERLVEGCLRHVLDALAARGFDSVEFDGHVSDPHLLPNWAKLQPSGRWFLLVELADARGTPDDLTVCAPGGYAENDAAEGALQ